MFAVGAVVYYLTLQAFGGAQEAIDGVLTLLSQQSTVTVQGNNWFAQQYGLIRIVALWVMLPLIIVSVIQSIAKGDMAQLVKSAVVYPAVALLGTIAAIRIVQLLINISDDFSNVFLAATGEDVNVFFENVRGAGYVTEEDLGKQLIILILSTLMILGGLVTFLMLIVREASIYLATGFLPLGFAMLVWPAVMKWFRTMVEFLIGIIFSKVVMCAILAIAVSSLGAAGLTSGGEQETLQLTGATVGNQDENPFAWFALLAVPVVLLFMMAASPGATTRLTGSLGLDNAAAALASNIGTRPGISRAFLGVRRQVNIGKSIIGSWGASRSLRRERREMRGRYDVNQKLAANAPITDANGSVHITDAMTGSMKDQRDALIRRGDTAGAALVERHRNEIVAMGNTQDMSNSANEVQWANQLLKVYQSGGRVTRATYDRNTGGGSIFSETFNANGSTNVNATVVDPVVNGQGRAVNRLPIQAAVQRINTAQQQARGQAGANGTASVTYLSGAAGTQQGAQADRLRNHFDKQRVTIVGSTGAGSKESGPRIEYVNGM